jgi:tetratricopeptide (TPR) repeat protein
LEKRIAAKLRACILSKLMDRFTAQPSGSRSRKVALLLSICLALIIGLLAVYLMPRKKPAPSKAVRQTAFQLEPAAVVYAAYGGSESCKECHEEEYDAWKHSHHALAERKPAPDLDDKAFNPARTFNHGIEQARVLATNGHYEIVTAGLHSTNETFKVERILAENPLRQMLVPFPGGRLQATEAAWDPRSNQWFDVYGNEDRKPGEWGHWTGRGMNWNSMCAQCHNTRLRKGYDAATDTYHTRMVETGVGCEACHGPMKAHNDWQHANKGKGLTDPTIHRLSREQMFDTCGSCHSRRSEITGDFKPGESYWDHYSLATVDDSDLFYADGQVRDEDFEFTAFLGSRMYHKGVRCIDCHDVHTVKTRLPGNFMCLSCHGAGTTNAPAINPVTHSHHKVFGFDTNGLLPNVDLSRYLPAQIKETGGECVNCHMPQTVYMQRHSRHDHGFTIPDPLLTERLGIPNACERCHADKGTEWNRSNVEKWYGTNMNRLYRQRAETVARARLGEDSARAPLLQLMQTDDSFYWRAVAANLLQRWNAEPAVAAALVLELQDTNALARQMAVRALGSLAQAGREDITAALRKTLEDPARNVHLEAARLLAATLDTNTLTGSEYLFQLHQVSDQPLGQAQAGLFNLLRNDPTEALSHYRKAVTWDPYSADLRHELAVLLSQMGQARQAAGQLSEAVKLTPGNAELHYDLALALNEVGETDRVIPELEQAVRLDPQHARAWYNLGLARSARGDAVNAEAALVRAESADPKDPRIPYARATVLARLGKLQEAKAAAQRALELDPNFKEAQSLLQQLK